MADSLDHLTSIVASKLRLVGFSSPRKSVIRALLEKAYLASLRTEEGRFVRGSLTFADPQNPDVDPPIVRRAPYPGFTAFGHRTPLTVELLVKLSRAIDQWSGSIAVYGMTAADLVAWGVVDQLVHLNVRRNREASLGARIPGILTVTMDAVGALSVYHGDLFLGGIRQDQLITRENDGLGSEIIARRIATAFRPAALGIAIALKSPQESGGIVSDLLREWSRTLQRLCIGLRRLGTGGAFLISPDPIYDLLDVPHRFPYQRLSAAVILRILDKRYERYLNQRTFGMKSKTVPRRLMLEHALAEADSTDRDLELAGAVRLVTSLASVDGLVLLTPSLGIIGFGVKIKSGTNVGTVYDGPDFARRGTAAKTIEPSRFGTRHGSILRYCRSDRQALGIIVSQDGQVRLVTVVQRSLTLWDKIQLLDHHNDARSYAFLTRHGREHRKRHRKDVSLGYSPMPKTLKALLRLSERDE